VITSETVLDPSVDRRLAVDLDAAEGDRLIAYQDIGGLWTCGRGHLLPPPAPGRTWAGFTVPQSTSDRWFSSDILGAMRLASQWPEFESCDTDARKNALAEIAFNMGSRWVQFGPTRAAITAKEWRTVHDHLLASLWAKQVGPTRSNRIANYFLTGEYP
jgi:GH24 family phage-related lysozyme (muramidase)